MRKDLLEFLFSSSQAQDMAEDESLGQTLQNLLEMAAEAEKEELESKEKPLANALADLGLTQASETVQLDPEGFSISTDEPEVYRDWLNLLGTPEAMHKLAEMGWVVTKEGDESTTNSKPDMYVRFLEITKVANDEPPSVADQEKMEKTKEIVKQAREFATTPMDRDDDMNPVDNFDPKKGQKTAGVSPAKSGGKTGSAVKDSAESLIANLLEKDSK